MKQDDIIGLKYRMLQKLGQGGNSSVFLAENLVLSNLWAVKAIHKGSTSLFDEMKEVNILKNLNHPMLPRIADLLEDEQYTYIVMDYIEGETLLDVIKREGRIDGPRLVGWARDLCDVLAYLHGQNPPVIYRDLKPSNIIVDNNGRLHLVDFGTAKTFTEEKLEDTVYIGTQGYAAPEQFGTGKSDERTDLFNLGMTLFHLASGIHPAQASMEQAERILRQEGVSRELSEIIKDLIQIDPKKRIGSVKACINRLENISRRFSRSEERTAQANNNNIRLNIALTGIQHGVGTTPTGIGIARYFSDKGYKTAFADYCQSGDMNRLENIFNLTGRLVRTSEKSFTADGITYIKDYTALPNLPRRDFNVIITDLGCLRHEKALAELNRADVKLVVCPAVDWKLEQIREFKDGFKESDPNEEWIYLFSSYGKADLKFIKNELQIKNVLIFPLIQNPFHQNRNEQKGIEEVLEKALTLSGMNLHV